MQRTLGKSTTLELGYNGSQSRKVANLINAGQPLPGTSAVITRMPYPEFGAAGIQFLKDDGVANYNGMGAKLSQRFGSDLSTLFSYTWSKSMDDGSAIRGPGNDFSAEDARCRACEKAASSFNVPHRFVATVVYALPFGNGPALPQQRRHRKPGVRRLAGQHHRDHAERLRDRYHLGLGLGGRGVLTEQRPAELPRRSATRW